MAQVLRYVPHIDDPRVLIDATTRDDAAVFQLSEDRALVVTVDFFAPIVDDPYAFGAIAAANALSDVYAMGAKPLLTLNIVGWPRDPHLLALLGDTLRGGFDKVREAGAFVMGGHSVDDKEPKYGMVALGEVHPDAIVSNAGAQPGDALVLTKPIGTGVLSTALKRGVIDEDDMAEATKVMATLNAGAAQAMHDLGDSIHAATDVTGFGLLGHLSNLLAASGQSAHIVADAVPYFEAAPGLVKQHVVPGGTERNLAAAEEFTAWWPGVDDMDKLLLADAQTSGGMILAVAADDRDRLVEALRKHATPVAAVIGEIVPPGDALIEVK